MSPRAFDRYMVQLGMGRNKKLLPLTDSEFRAHVVGVLALAAQATPRGYLLVGDQEATAEEIANEAGGRVTARVAASAVVKLKQRGVLEWDEHARAWWVHDWDAINPDPRQDETATERQRKRRERLRASRSGHGGVTAASRVTERDSHAPVTGLSRGEVEEEGGVEVRPAPPNGGAGVAASPPPADPADEQREHDVTRLCELMSDEVRAAHGIAASSREARPVKGWHDACRAMLTRDGLTVRQIEYAIPWVCRHHYWSRRIKSMTRLRSEMSEVAADIRRQREPGATVTRLPTERDERRLAAARRLMGERTA